MQAEVERIAGPAPVASARASRLIRLLDAEPDFAADVAADEAAAARRHTVARVVTLRPGPFSPATLRDASTPTGPFAAVVLSGLVARDIVLADRVATQLVGAGDVIPLADWDDGSPPVHAEWRVGAETELAVLDHRFLAAAQRWPWLTARVVERAARWADRAATLQAITQLGRVDLRLVALLWHLADRWGRMGAEGVVLPLRLTHEALGRLVGAQRPTVTLALRQLRAQGAVVRLGAGWLLAVDSRALLEPQGVVAPPPDVEVVAEATPASAEVIEAGRRDTAARRRDTAARRRDTAARLVPR
jgi:CRP/FNR family cyclic AMP-dependent transcriptional regulator